MQPERVFTEKKYFIFRTHNHNKEDYFMKKSGVHIALILLTVCWFAGGCISTKNENVITPVPDFIQTLTRHSWTIDSIIFLDAAGNDSAGAGYGAGNAPGFSNSVVQLYMNQSQQQLYASYDKTNTSLPAPPSTAIPAGDTTLFLYSYDNGVTAMWSLNTTSAPATPDTLVFQTIDGGQMFWMIDLLNDQSFKIHYTDTSVAGNAGPQTLVKKVYFNKLAGN
jgi:hypothetical protein